ncbi:MAG: hypothetical protein ACQEXX_15265 [Bacillota bacterium]
MSRACYQVAWGLLLIMIDIRIVFFDVVPDLLGFILLLVGLYRLKRENVYFGIGCGAAWALMALSAIQFLMTFGQPAVGIESIGSIPPMHYELQNVPLIGYLVLGYGLCKGIELRADSLKQTVLKRAARTRLGFYVVTYLMWLIVFPFGFNVDQDIMIMLYFVFGLGIIICSLSVILLVRAAARWWGNERRAV